MSTTRRYSPLDHWLIQLDTGLRTVFGQPAVSERSNPADGVPTPDLDAAERDRSARLMRVNHTGEVAAQGLYQGQALTARLTQVRDQMERAALEENDHLAWCEQRIQELGTHTSRLNPLWYLGSMAIGAAAGVAGDKWSLGFVAETERQVVAHLDDHLHRLPPSDGPSRAILKQMQDDEQRHGTQAISAGGAQLPTLISKLMRGASQVMTRTAYWV